MVNVEPLRVVFFGTPEFAVPTFDALRRSPHRVVGVVTQPDRPRGRGRKTGESAVKTRASAANLPVFQPNRLNDPAFLDALAGLHAELGVVVAYGKILPEAVLHMPRLGLVNVHASLLPRYRGAAPIQRAIINGDRETGITIVRMVLALDAGPMLATARRPIGPDETSEEVAHDLAQMGATALMSSVGALATGPLPEVAQDESAATYAARLTKDDGTIDWTLPAQRVHDLIRGLYPWPHAFTYHRGRRVIVLRSTTLPAAEGQPGRILEAEGDRLHVGTGQGAIAITKLQAEGGRPMTPREFLAGHRASVGDLLAPES